MTALALAGLAWRFSHNNDDYWSGLLLNVATDIFGMGLTIVVIDRLLEHRERVQNARLTSTLLDDLTEEIAEFAKTLNRMVSGTSPIVYEDELTRLALRGRELTRMAKRSTQLLASIDPGLSAMLVRASEDTDHFAGYVEHVLSGIAGVSTDVNERRRQLTHRASSLSQLLHDVGAALGEVRALVDRYEANGR